jgi:hypothetical protein
MLHIRPEELRAALADHLPQLAAAQAEIDAAAPIARKDVIDRYRPLWAALKPLLESLSHGKCWYSECSSIGAPNDVDHFRPKQAVMGTSPRHPGYYWLALAWNNFRLSCQRVNRRETDPRTGIVGGKGAHFPLLDPSSRAYRPSDPIADESPLFLDPLVATDVAMLSFDSDGKVALHPRFQRDDTAKRRLEASRTYLHLDWHQFIEQRKLLYWRISDLVEHAEKHAPTPGSPASDEFKQGIGEIVTLIRRNSEYSRAANVYVRSFRSRWWIEEIVLELVAA